MKIIKIVLFLFSELSEKAKEKAINELSNINVMHDWWDSVYSDAETIGLKLKTFDLDRNKHAKGSIIGTHEETAKLILENHGKDCDTYKIAEEFLKALANFETISEKENRSTDTEVDDANEEFLNRLLEAYANILQNECDYLQSKEAIIETIEANEYTFTKEGKLNNSNGDEEVKEYFFLFGETICRAYHEEEFEEIIRLINVEGIEFAIHKFTECDHPEKIMEAASGWMDYATINKNEYEKLLQIEDKN